MDKIIQSMGLKVYDRDGNEVMISDYMDEGENDNQKSNKQTRGKRELRNLEWEFNDGTNVMGLERFERAGRGKKCWLMKTIS